MLARNKSKSLSKQNASLRDDSSHSAPSANTSLPLSSKKGMSPSSSNASFSSSFTIKREEKDNPTKPKANKRQISFGFTPKQERPVEQSDVLGAIIPGMSETLFAPEVNNLQKARELKKLLNCLGDWGSINDQVLFKLIDILKKNVDALDDKMAALVSQILDSNWCSRSPKVVKAFESFISELMVVRPFYTGTVLQSLLKKFLPQYIGSFQNQNPDQIAEADAKVFEIAHCNLAKLLEAFPIPRMRESCVKTMGATYPYMGKGAYVHYCYVKNLITSISYAPQIAMQILHLCIHKLCRIDVNVPREDSERFNEAITESFLAEEVKSESGERITVKFDKQEVINSIVVQSSINPLVNILDLCLSVVFECFENFLENCESEEDLEQFYDALTLTFETEILPTFGVNHVQFLYFYLVSTHPNYTRKFLDFLWKKATDLNTSAVIRMQAMSYISGVLARSNVVSVKQLKRWLTTMADWANAYVDQRVKNSHWSSVNLQMHGPFYAVCQCIFYVFAFRNKDLVGSRKCTAFTGTLNLGRLVTCDLNPLKAVIHPVAIAFVKAAHVHQISYCQTVLERNQRATIPTTVRDSMSVTAMDSIGPTANILDSFFPFDPFHLPRSKKWVDPTFRIYEAYLPEVKIEKAESDRFSDQNEDSIDMELSTSFHDREGGSHLMARFMDRDNFTNFMDES